MNLCEYDEKLLRTARQALDEKFGIDIKILDIRHISVMADYFIITSGNNVNQVRSMADEAEDKLSLEGYKIRHLEGYQEGNWILLDFGNVIIHIFDKANREFYDLERIWGDAHPITF